MIPTPSHFVRFGSHNEQPFFSGALANTYDGILFNANLVAWSAVGIAGFICEQNLIEKPFVIDPLTHAFQHDPSVLLTDDGRVKASVERLVEAYGDPLTDLVGNAALIPKELSSASLREEFTDRVLEFQRNALDKAARETDAWPILQFKYGNDLALAPKLIVAPYFFMRGSTFDEWIELNVALAQTASERARRGEEVAIELVIAKDVLTNSKDRDKLVERFGELDVGTLLLWIDDLSEHSAGLEELSSLKQLCEGFAEREKSIVNMYGGFFSILLCHREQGILAGVCHGPQYGEDRSVLPVGGGLPTARFYLRALHHRVRFADALRILQRFDWLASESDFFENVCSCAECRRLISEQGSAVKGFLEYGQTKPITFQRGESTVTMNYPVRETQVSATRHYMYSKQWEFNIIQGSSMREIRDRLERIRRDLGPVIGLDSVAHATNWSKVLS